MSVHAPRPLRIALKKLASDQSLMLPSRRNRRRKYSASASFLLRATGQRLRLGLRHLFAESAVHVRVYGVALEAFAASCMLPGSDRP